MVVSYLKIRPQVTKALIDIHEQHLDFTIDEVTILQSVLDNLKPIELVVHKLNEARSSLFVARSATDLLLDELTKLPTSQFNFDLVNNLTGRIEERRTPLWAVHYFLKTGKFCRSYDFTSRSMLTNRTRHKFDIQLFAYGKQANKKSSNILFLH